MSNIIIGNRFGGIEIKSSDENIRMTGCVLRRQKDTLDFETKFDSLSLDDLKDCFKNIPISISINDNNVIIKKCISTSETDQHILNTAFPNINLSEFYYEILKYGQSAFVAICRKEHVKGIIEKLIKPGLNIIGFNLGNLSIATFSQYFNTDIIYSSNSCLQVEEGKLNDLKFETPPTEIDYNFNGLQVNSTLVLSMISAFNMVLGIDALSTNIKAQRDHLLKTFKDQRLFKLLKKSALSIVFIALLINFVLYSFYFEKTSNLRQQSLLYSSSTEQIAHLRESNERKGELVSQILGNGNSQSSLFLNEIIAILPVEILLKDLNYQPLIRTVRSNKPIEFLNSTILIKGQVTNANSFSQWIDQLEKNSLFKKVEVLGFKDLSDDYSEFELKIEVNHE